MLFSEMVRIIRDEETLVSDTSSYPSSTAVHDWENRVTKQITLTEEKLVCLRFTTSVYVNGTYDVVGQGRVLLNDVPLISSGPIAAYNGTASRIRAVYLLLSSGTYTFTFQTSIWYKSAALSYNASISNIIIAALKFPDKSLARYNSGLISCPANSTTTLINQNFTTPQTRKLAVGSIKKYIAHIFVYAERQDQRVSKMKNVGESDEANFFNWKILLNDSQVNWSERYDDYESKGTTNNPTYGEGAFGRLSIALDPNTTYNLKINCYNGFSSAYNGRAVVSIIICPWILPDTDSEVITLDFPQGSTLYIILEPLHDNPTKYIKIGKKRPISFGDATDYYSSASGTGILSHYYTFEIVDVANSVLMVSGFGGCISVLAVDVR